MTQQKIKDNISPKFRKKVRFAKTLSEEEHWILKQKGRYSIVFVLAIFLSIVTWLVFTFYLFHGLGDSEDSIFNFGLYMLIFMFWSAGIGITLAETFKKETKS